MSTKGSFLRENSAAMLAALLGVAAAFIGAYVGARSTEDVWRKDKIYQFNKDLVNKRIDIIQEITRSHVDAQRVSMIKTFVKIDEAAIINQFNTCKGAAKINKCKVPYKPSVDTNSAVKEIADMQAKYFSSTLLAQLYFCDKTRLVLSDMQKKHINWWEFDEKDQENLVNTMISEIQCGMDFQAVFK